MAQFRGIKALRNFAAIHASIQNHSHGKWLVKEEVYLLRAQHSIEIFKIQVRALPNDAALREPIKLTFGHPRGDMQHLLSSAPPQQTALLQRTSNRIIRCLQNRECRRLITGPCHLSFRLRSLCDNAVFRTHTRSGVGRENRRPGENDRRGVSEWRKIWPNAPPSEGRSPNQLLNGCGKDSVPSAVVQWYDSPENGSYLGKIGLSRLIMCPVH
jgi:hypothetical protein